MDRFTIKEVAYGSKEYEACKRLRDELLRKPLGLTLSAKDLDGEDKQIHVAAIRDDGMILGTVTLKPLSKTGLKLRQMAVSNEMQGKGLGTKLVQSALAMVKEKGFVAIETHARIEAQGFYEKLGFGAQGAVFTEIGLPHVRMVNMGKPL